MKLLLLGAIGDVKRHLKITFLVGKSADFPNSTFIFSSEANNIVAVRQSISMLEKIKGFIATIHQYDIAVLKS
ncbi:hypothetical protein EFM17_07155 [Lactobacillus delbrueckii]|nr:hypothetical protein [Lactobacillus delbrueckii]